jgi:hypothetical protein
MLLMLGSKCRLAHTPNPDSVEGLIQYLNLVLASQLTGCTCLCACCVCRSSGAWLLSMTWLTPRPCSASRSMSGWRTGPR